MDNLVENEQKLAKEKMLKEIDYHGTKIVELTIDNVAIVEAMIQENSSYMKSIDKEAGPKYNKNNKIIYGGSSAFWMTMLKKVLINKENVKYTYEQLIKGAVESIDRENSTHLNSDSCGRCEIINRICKFNKRELIECLRNPQYKEMKLFFELERITSADKKARRNISFASKFCHYACFYILEDTKYQDNYSIYDKIIKSVLPLYLNYYEIVDEYDLKDYVQYSRAIDAIRDKLPDRLSRNGLDHLLWYYYKGRIS